MPGQSPFLLPASFTRVWAFADPHGVRSGLSAALVAAGLITPAGRWCAPAGTALVGCGDYLDRGTDARGLIDLLASLAAEAAEAGGAVVLARGNHEQLALEASYGEVRAAAGWLAIGGDATLRSLGVRLPGSLIVANALRAAIEDAAPGLRSWLNAMPECVVWNDVLFVHGGPPRGRALEDYGRRRPGDWRGAEFEHLWLRGDFYRTPGLTDDEGYAPLRAAGIRRVVFGHTPHDGPRLYHADRSLNLDTNACANGDGPAALTLARIPVTGSLVMTELVRIDTASAPDRMTA